MCSNVILTILLLTLLLVLSHASITQNTCNSQVDCSSCLQNLCTWCGQEGICKSTPEECITHNVTWWKNDKKNEKIPHYPCPHNGVITHIEQCPSFKISLNRQYASSSINMVYPLSRQPILHIEGKNLSTQSMEFLFGGYFHHTPQESFYKPHLFSFNYYIFGTDAYGVDVDHNMMTTFDLAIIGAPGNYKMGFGVAIIEKETGNAQCAFINSDQIVVQSAVYSRLFFGAHFFFGIPWLCIALGLHMFLLFCCARKFERSEEDITEITDSLGVERSLQSTKPITQRILDMLKNLIMMDDISIIKHTGTNVFFYNRFQKWLMIYCFICGVISMTVLLPYYYSSEDYPFYGDFASTTIAALDFSKRSTLLFVLVSVLFPIFGVMFLARLQRLARVIAKADGNYGSLYTVMATNVSSNIISRRDFKHYFETKYGKDNVVEANLALDVRKLENVLRQHEEAQKELEKAQKQLHETNMRPIYKSSCWGKEVDAIHYWSSKIAKLDKKISKFKRADFVKGSGIGFVTFSSIQVAQNCIESTKPFKFLGIPIRCPWKYSIEQAPEAEDILWKNLGTDPIKRWFKTLGFSVIMSIILFIVYLVTYINNMLVWKKDQNASSFNDWVQRQDSTSFLLAAFFELLPEIITLVNEIIKPTLEAATELEEHNTRNDYRKSIIKKTVFVMFLNCLVLPRLYLYFLGVWTVPRGDEPFNTYHYFFNRNGVDIIKFFMTASFVAKGFELFFAFCGLIIGYLKRGKFQRLKYDYEGNYSFKVTLLFLWMIYGILQPLVFPFALFYFIFNYYLDKFLIMYVYEKSEDSDGFVLSQVILEAGYYMSIFPFCMIFLIPSIVTDWKTWIIYMPVWIIFSVFIWNFRKNAAKNIESKDRIIVGKLREAKHETSILKKLFGFVMGYQEEMTLAQVEHEVEKMGIDIKKMAAKYRPPYLAKLKKYNQQKLEQV